MNPSMVHPLDPVPDPAPLTGPTRTALEWDGSCWIEIDPATGNVLDHGDVDHEH